ARRFLRWLRRACRRQSSCQGALWPLESSQSRGCLQVLRTRPALRLFARCAAQRSIAIHQGAVMIGVIDYGAGNLRSVQNTLDENGAPHVLVRDADGLAGKSKLVLPGVGHFGQMMRALDALGLRQALLDSIAGGVPFLGICLGLQGLFTESAEAPG